MICKVCQTEYDDKKSICPNCGLHNQNWRQDSFGSNPVNNSDKPVLIYESEENQYYGIQTHNFEKAKAEIKAFLDKTKKDPQLYPVKTKEGLFNLKNHRVNGDELNTIINIIQNYLIENNERHKEFVDSFRDVYEAFDYLDKDYISGIMTAVGAADVASQKALKAQKELDSTIECLEDTVNQLDEFRSRVESYNHLNELDKLWETIYGEDTKETKEQLDNRLSNLTEQTEMLRNSNKVSNKRIILAVVLSCVSSVLVVVDLVLHIIGVL